MDLSDVFASLGGHDVGSWYHLDERCVGWSRKRRRPFMVAIDYRGGPIVKMRPRSTSRREGVQHPAHPKAHVPGCAITLDGWIPRRLVAVKAECLTNCYSCMEPDDEIIAACRADL